MSGLTLTQLADRVGELMPAISREFLRSQTMDFYKVKITLPQCVILGTLDKNEESNMSELAKGMNVTTAAMTGVIDRLVRDGYVTRENDPDDRRVIKVRLTAKGDKVAKMLHEHRRQMTMKLLGVLSEQEREDYLKILTRIKDGIKS
jgi:DNA-binding MarR family transcriptional regulator